jgi:inner membrane protein
MEIRYKPEETPITLAAKKTYLGRVYLSWAQYPITETEEISDGPAAYLVRLRDLRYTYPGQPPTKSLGGTVTLTRDLQVVSEQIGMRGKSTTEK